MERKLDWPTKPDGTPMMLGEMTTAQRQVQMRAFGALYEKEYPAMLMQEKAMAIIAGARIDH